jgi:hypothetical protein
VRLPTSKKVLREDVKGAPSWINPLIDTLNSFMETVYQAMNRNITFSENIGCVIKELTYKTPSTYPTGVDEVEFTSTLKVRATGLMLMQAYEKVLYTPPPGPVYIPWTENAGMIRIGTITGLEADKTYLIRILLS